MSGSSLECGGNRAGQNQLRLLIAAAQTLRRPWDLCQYIRLDALAAEHAPSISALFHSYEGVRNVFKVAEFAIVYFEELDLYFAVELPFERNSHQARFLSQGEGFNCLGKMHQQPFSRRVGAPDGHTVSMGTRRLDRY